jgi:hypothetical protein
MISFIVFGRFAQLLWRGLGDPAFRGWVVIVITLLLTGTLVHHQAEGRYQAGAGTSAARNVYHSQEGVEDDSR